MAKSAETKLCGRPAVRIDMTDDFLLLEVLFGRATVKANGRRRRVGQQFGGISWIIENRQAQTFFPERLEETHTKQILRTRLG
jgi:hypothetical protein